MKRVLILLLTLLLGTGCSAFGDAEETAVVETLQPPTPTVVPTATAMPTPTQRPTPSFVTFAETAKVSEDLLYVEGLLAEVSVEERLIILTGNADVETPEHVQVLLASGDVPTADSGIRRSPCPAEDPTSQPNRITQNFYWEAGMYWETTPGYHPGVDIVCEATGSSTVVYAPVDNLVIARYWIDFSTDQNTIKFWSSGTTYIGKTNMAAGRLNPTILATLGITSEEYVPMLFAVGHMLEGGDWPQPGTVVTLGAAIGNQGSTGYSTGPHVHYAWFIEMADGTLYAVDPLTAFVY